MTEDEIKLHKESVDWVKAHIGELYNELINNRSFDSAIVPAASFMAGTPGAGKTEFSKRLIENFTEKPLRIDTDELREKIPGYTGNNSRIVQGAASVALEKILDKVLHNKYPFILDTTFSIGKAIQNLKRASRKGYSLQLYFIYQDPIQAWEVTRAREVEEGRNVLIQKKTATKQK
jgi:UDP-N-acetylglucosamine kinase